MVTRRLLAIATLAWLTSGCTSTTTVPGSALRAVSERSNRTATLVGDTENQPVRIDPNTQLRLRLRDGRTSAFLTARDLSANEHGIFQERSVTIGDASSLVVTGLDVADGAVLEQTRPRGGTLGLSDGGAASMNAPPEQLRIWATDALIALAAKHVSPEWRARAGALTETPCPIVYGRLRQGSSGASKAKNDAAPTWEPGWWCKPRISYADASAFEYVHARLPGSLGVWSIHVGDLGTAPIAGRDIDALFAGTPLRAGTAWEDVSSAEVVNVSGSKTAAALLLAAGVGVALAPLAIFGLDAHAAAHGDPLGAGRAPSLPALSGGGDSAGIAVAAPVADAAPTLPDEGATSLFSSRASRRAYVRFGGALEGTGTLQQTFSESAIVTMRVFDIFEIGGGVSEIETRASGKSDASTVGLFRTGLHAWLDERRRIALPIAVDLGSGGDDIFHLRLITGVRFALTDTLEVSLYPVTPAWDQHRELPSRWTWQSGAGISYSFF